MDSLSYLIENNNQVKIDEKLLKNIQKKSTKNQRTDSRDQQKPKSPCNAKSKYMRKLSPKINNPRLSPKGDKGTPKNILFKITPQNPTSPRMIDRQDCNSKLFTEQETVQILNSKIESLKSSQREMEAKYTQTINNLKLELHKRNEQYEGQCEEFNKIKQQLKATKSDINNLIKLLTSKKPLEDDKKLVVNKEQFRPNMMKPKPIKQRSILSTFAKMTPRQG